MHQQFQEYKKDTILLLEGLLQTDGINYFQIKKQLDEQYRLLMKIKILELNKLVNVQEQSFLDVASINNRIQSYIEKNSKLLKKIEKGLNGKRELKNLLIFNLKRQRIL